MTASSSPEHEIAAWLKVVESKVGALRFGSVQIIVHEGRVTQVESTEKFRFASRQTNEPDIAGSTSAGTAENERTDS